jgi:hypothetical protein
MRHICDNCGVDWAADDLHEVKRYSLRVDRDGPAPSGECPDCGALCYPAERAQKEARRKDDAFSRWWQNYTGGNPNTNAPGIRDIAYEAWTAGKRDMANMF